MVGSNCLKYFEKQEDVKVVGTYYSYKTDNTVFFDTLEFNNPKNFDVDSFHPDLIMHCGALTHVDYCEANEEESYAKTVLSTINVTKLCNSCKARMIYVSSDYVFDGENGPYDENAKVNPISVYGSHKLEAEQAVLEQVPNSIVIRITNVYGDEERKKNFIIRIVDKILNGQPMELKLPVDQYATPVNAYDVARTLYLLARDKKAGIYNISSDDYLNRVELVEKIISHFPKNKISFESVTTEELKQAAPRPLKGGLINEKFKNEYPEFVFTSVDDYLNKFANGNGN